MATCKLCSKENPDAAKFCGSCGTPLMAAQDSTDSLDQLFQIDGAPDQSSGDLFSIGGADAQPPGAPPAQQDFDALFPNDPSDLPAQDGLSEGNLGALFDTAEPAPPATGASDNSDESVNLEGLFESEAAPHGGASPAQGDPGGLEGLFESSQGAPSDGAAEAAKLEELFSDLEGSETGPAAASPEPPEEERPSLEDLFAEVQTSPEPPPPAEDGEDDQAGVGGSTADEFARLAAERSERKSGGPISADEFIAAERSAEDDEAAAADDEEESATTRQRSRKKKAKARSPRIRVQVVQPESWTKKLASFILLVGTCLLAGKGLAVLVPPSVPYAWAIIAAVLVGLTFLIRKLLPRLFRIHMTTLAAVLGFSVYVLHVHGDTGPSSPALLFGLGPDRLLVFVTLGILIIALYYALFNSFLFSGFRLFFAVLGVFGTLSLWRYGVFGTMPFLAIAKKRILFPQPPQNVAKGMQVAFRLFEPLFVGLNMFLPCMGITAFFETFKHLLRRQWDKALTALLFLAIFAAAVYFSVRILDANGVDNLRSMFQEIRKVAPTG